MPMNINASVKKSVFIFLIALFLAFTVLVDTVGTTEDLGAYYLNASAQQGKLLYQQYNCTTCHQLYGLGGYMGPDLTNEISYRKGNSGYIKGILSAGARGMPDFKLSQCEIDQLTDYLIYVDKTGSSPTRRFEINLDGTVNYLRE
jgi:nitric oxide reductase subunit C